MDERIRAKWERLRPWLRPLRRLDRPPNPYGLRLRALEAIERGLFPEAMALARAASLLPPEAMGILLSLPLGEAVSRIGEALSHPTYPKRPPPNPLRLQEESMAPLLSLLAAGVYAGHLPGDLERYRRLLVRLEAPHLELARAFLQGQVQLGREGPETLRALEDLLRLLALLKDSAKV